MPTSMFVMEVVLVRVPPLPEPDAHGRFPAIAYARASLARKIIRRRRALGMSQSDLARRAGLRVAGVYPWDQTTHQSRECGRRENPRPPVAVR